MQPIELVSIHYLLLLFYISNTVIAWFTHVWSLAR